LHLAGNRYPYSGIPSASEMTGFPRIRASPEPRTRGRFRDLPAVVSLAGAAAVLAATAQLLRDAYVHFGSGSFAWASRDALWMTPLAFLSIFVVVACLQFGLGLLVRHLGTPASIAFTLIALSVFSMLLNLSRVAPLASLVLAIGVASFVAPRLTRRRRHLLTSAAGVIAAVMASLAIGERLSRSGDAQLAVDAPAGAPNVLLIIWDTVRAANTSLYGYGRQTTPFLSRLGSEGVVFEHASAPSSWTLPSHASFFTGKRPAETGVGWRTPYDGRSMTLAEAFRDRGYSTVGIAANVLYTTWESGLNRGFDTYEDYPVSVTQVAWTANLLQLEMVRDLVQARSLRAILSIARQFEFRMPPEPRRHRPRAEHVVSRFLAWRRDNKDRPFFAFLNFFDAHERFLFPMPYRTMYGERKVDVYDGGIRYMDEWLRVLVDSLRTLGELDRTIIVLTSDHGEQFGEHGLRAHDNSLYAQLTQVPLVVRYPGRVSPGLRHPGAVSLMDLPATIADLAGLPPGSFPGRSFAPDSISTRSSPPIFMEVASLDAALDEQTPNAHGSIHSVIVFPWHYIRNADSTEHLFDLSSDPGEAFDLAGTAERRPDLLRLRSSLDSILAVPPTLAGADTLAGSLW
jgi:arylsulfatase A-like enzyme